MTLDEMEAVLRLGQAVVLGYKNRKQEQTVSLGVFELGKIRPRHSTSSISVDFEGSRIMHHIRMRSLPILGIDEVIFWWFSHQRHQKPPKRTGAKPRVFYWPTDIWPTNAHARIR